VGLQRNPRWNSNHREQQWYCNVCYFSERAKADDGSGAHQRAAQDREREAWQLQSETRGEQSTDAVDQHFRLHAEPAEQRENEDGGNRLSARLTESPAHQHRGRYARMHAYQPCQGCEKGGDARPGKDRGHQIREAGMPSELAAKGEQGHTDRHAGLNRCEEEPTALIVPSDRAEWAAFHQARQSLRQFWHDAATDSILRVTCAEFFVATRATTMRAPAAVDAYKRVKELRLKSLSKG
jgi:hypothetical protein